MYARPLAAIVEDIAAPEFVRTTDLEEVYVGPAEQTVEYTNIPCIYETRSIIK